jgi:hypothetical protein
MHKLMAEAFPTLNLLKINSYRDFYFVRVISLCYSFATFSKLLLAAFML